MIAALKDAARALSVIAPDFKTGTGKALEAEVLFALAADFKRHHADVTARNHRGHLLRGAFVLRGGPGHLPDPKSASPQPSHFAIKINNHVIELHNSLEFAGCSKTEHEVDVSAVWAEQAQRARSADRRVVDGPPLLGVELKEFSAGISLAKNVVRSFFACIIDFIPTWALRPVTITGPHFEGEFWPKRRPEGRFWILTTGELSGPSRTFASAYNIELVDKLDRASFDRAIGEMTGQLNMMACLRPA